MGKITIRVKRREPKDERCEGSLFVRVTFGRRSREVALNCRVLKDEWLPEQETVYIAPGIGLPRSQYLVEVMEQVMQACRLLWTIAGQLETQGDFTVCDIVTAYFSRVNGTSFEQYAAKLAEEWEQRGSNASKRHYVSLKNSFMAFVGSKITLQKITEDVILQYETHLKDKGLAPNTVVSYLCLLRALMNKAVAEGLLEKRPSLFCKVNTTPQKTAKRAVDEAIIKKIEQLSNNELEMSPIKQACDLFLFSYYTRGMAFIDVAHLTIKNLEGDTLRYVRHKTKEELCVKLLPQAKAILERYRTDDSPYLFPMMRSKGANRTTYESALRLQNLRLKKVSMRVGAKITTYVARHTWASVSKSKGIPIEWISEGLGHVSLRATQYYIKKLDNSRLDRINQYVIQGKGKLKEIIGGSSVSW